MLERNTAHDSQGPELSSGELLSLPDAAYLLPIVGATVIEATNQLTPHGQPDGMPQKCFAEEPDRKRP